MGTNKRCEFLKGEGDIREDMKDREFKLPRKNFLLRGKLMTFSIELQ